MATAGPEGGDTTAGPEGGDTTRPGWLPRSRIGAVVAVLAAAVMAAFWVWAFSPFAPSGHPDTLADAAWARRAEAVCTETTEALYRMPGAAVATGPADRAGQISDSTELLGEMVADLRILSTELIGPDAAIVTAWLVDWDTYLDDRRAYAATLRGGQDPPFTVTARDGDAITGYIDAFATANPMAECATPDDV